mmetsp:Transcript_132953/g.384402  ORF Transcript_132953/g.384402 Transcript_132953/m.384402 type:complete len:244 (-) Transcript_132953:50-781(-)
MLVSTPARTVCGGCGSPAASDFSPKSLSTGLGAREPQARSSLASLASFASTSAMARCKPGTSEAGPPADRLADSAPRKAAGACERKARSARSRAAFLPIAIASAFSQRSGSSRPRAATMLCSNLSASAPPFKSLSRVCLATRMSLATLLHASAIDCSSTTRGFRNQNRRASRCCRATFRSFPETPAASALSTARCSRSISRVWHASCNSPDAARFSSAAASRSDRKRSSSWTRARVCSALANC